jgi:hypothetical protein
MGEHSSQFKGTIQYREEGDVWGLRSMALQAPKKEIEKRVLDDLNLPSNSKTSLEFTGDPLDLSQFYELRMNLEVPEAFLGVGRDMVIRNFGLPATPEVIQKLGVPRQYPVHSDGGVGRTFDARITFSAPFSPAMPEAKIETPFRKASFNASLTGNQVTLHFEQMRLDADFPFEQREEGVKQQRRDRNTLKRFIEDALSFKPLP